MSATTATLFREIDRLRAMLRKHQWNGNLHDDEYYGGCPECHRLEPDEPGYSEGHRPDCAYAALLGGGA